MARVRELLAGRYELLEIVGRGGMGVVYRARDRVLDREVAVKLLPAERAEDPRFVARFEREARAAAALNHPNIVAVFDTGRDADEHFIVMEYAGGRSLAALIREHGRMPAERAVPIAAQIAGALAAAHGAGIIHRDVKPSNVMVDDSDAVKVLDFGIARAVESTSLTQTAAVLGSAPYLAPEVARGERADERSDIYSMGCLLYELLTGRPPFSGELAAAVLHQHSVADPRPPRELNPRVPAPLDALVLRMLAKRPEQRPQPAGLLPAQLQATLRDDRTSPTAPLPADHAATARVTEPTRALGAMRRPGKARLLPAAALAALAIAALLLALPGSSGRHPRRTANHTASQARRQHPAPKPSHRPTTSTAAPANSPPTVADAAGALTTLITQDLQSGAIDQHGQDLLNHLQDILTSYQQAHASDALHKIDDLTKHIADLSQHGDIRASAIPAITSAVNNLRAVIERSTPAAPSTP